MTTKPKHLLIPYSWEERRPCLFDSFLCVPNYYDKHEEFNLPEMESIFENEHPVHLEYCSGNGQWIIEHAARNPQLNWIAVEMRIDRVKKIWAKGKSRWLNNLLVVFAEAQTFTRFYLKDECISQTYVNFPDPWPKNKHAKNRLIQQPFVKEIARISKPQGKLTLVTDDIDYRDQILGKVLHNPDWQPTFDAPHYVNEWKDFGTSYFDQLWRELGRNINYLDFRKEQKNGRETATTKLGS